MIINFVSGNQGKVREISNIIKKSLLNIEIRQLDIDLPEYQGDSEFIVMKKLKEARKNAGNIEGAILVEDSSLLLNAYSGLPGPYIKYFLKAVGPEGIYKMVTPYEDHTATAQCIMGLQLSNDEPRLFTGKTEGEIVKPRGNNGFGYDTCFQINSINKTYGEISEQEKNEISHRMKATKLMLEFLKNHNDQIK